jgi:hypothetical protein
MWTRRGHGSSRPVNLDVVARAASHPLLSHSNPSSDHISWLLVPISLVSTLKSSLPPLASLETTPGPDSTSTPMQSSNSLSDATPQRGLEIHRSLLALEQIQGLFPWSRNCYCRLCWLPCLRGCLPPRRPRSRRRCPLQRPPLSHRCLIHDKPFPLLLIGR